MIWARWTLFTLQLSQIPVWLHLIIISSYFLVFSWSGYQSWPCNIVRYEQKWFGMNSQTASQQSASTLLSVLPARLWLLTLHLLNKTVLTLSTFAFGFRYQAAWHQLPVTPQQTLRQAVPNVSSSCPLWLLPTPTPGWGFSTVTDWRPFGRAQWWGEWRAAARNAWTISSLSLPLVTISTSRLKWNLKCKRFKPTISNPQFPSSLKTS